MEKLSIKAYAKKHKMSIFNVMKKVREHSVKSESVLEDGKEVIYIVEDKAQEATSQKPAKTLAAPSDLFIQVQQLKDEVARLRSEVEMLKARISQ